MDIETNDRPVADAPVPRTGAHRPGLDSTDIPELDADPECEEGRTDVAVDATFPASDPSSVSQPGKTQEPVPSSGFREKD